MQLADRSPTAPTAVADRAAQAFSGSNQKAYLRLKLALSLNLRRQIFLAVCDDLALRNRIAARLYAELAYPSSPPTTAESPLTAVSQADAVHSDSASRIAVPNDRLLIQADGSGTPSNTEPLSRLLYPRLVSLNLNLSDPNPMVQIAEWLAQYPPPKGAQQRSRTPGFQILGTERLTRQPASVQKRFLSSLQRIEHYLSCLESALLLWLPRPWLHAVQQSAPDFWNWHTALFEFEGDPTPALALSVRPGAPNPHPAVPAPAVPVVAIDANDHSASETVTPTATPPAPVSMAPSAPTVPALEALHVTAQSVTGPTQDVGLPTQAPGSPKENLWVILSHDLARLQDNHQESFASNQSEAEPPALNHLQPDQPEHNVLPPILDAIATDATPVTIATNQSTTVPVDHAIVEVHQSDATLSSDLAPTSDATSTSDTTPTTVDAPSAVLPVTTSPPRQNHAILELADSILAVAAAEAGGHSSNEDSHILRALQQIEQLHLQEAPNATLLAAYQNLGNICRDRVEQGNASPQQMLLTIRVHEQMLQWLDETSTLWSDLLNDIGNLYWMLSRHGLAADESLSYLEQAIATYQQALQKTNPQTRPHNYAMIQNNLGSAYGDQARFQDPAENLEQSVLAYEAALRYRKLADDPARYAATQNNLGTAYWNLAQHQQPVRRLKQAIAAYFEALRYYSPDCEPIHYAMIQNNLGTAYWNLAQQPQANLGVATATGKDISPAELLQRAIAAYRAALVYRTLEVAPAAHAATQNNLGTAYWQLASLMEHHPDQRQTLLQQATAAYKAAIAAVQYLAAASTVHAPALSFDPAATHNNLGLAYYQLATDKHHRDDSKQRFSYLEAALHHHLKSLQSWQPQSELYQTVFSYVVQTARAFHNEFGTKGQTQALSQMPAHLLPEVLKQL